MFSASIEFWDESEKPWSNVLESVSEDGLQEDVDVYRAEITGCGGRVSSIVWHFPPQPGMHPADCRIVELF